MYTCRLLTWQFVFRRHGAAWCSWFDNICSWNKHLCNMELCLVTLSRALCSTDEERQFHVGNCHVKGQRLTFFKDHTTYTILKIILTFLASKCANRQTSDTNIIPIIHSGYFLYYYERDFMSHLHWSKQYDIIYMFNDNFQYLDNIFTTNNPELEEHIPDIYPPEPLLNKANTSDKETSFL